MSDIISKPHLNIKKVESAICLLSEARLTYLPIPWSWTVVIDVQRH